MPELALPLDLASVGQARGWVGNLLSGWTEPGRSRAVLVTSELVANGILHARSPVALALDIEDDCARIEVSDADPSVPITKHYGEYAPTGRGLPLVARLSEEWGARPAKNGKTVWAVVRDQPWDHPGPEAAPTVELGRESKRPPVQGSFVVRLLDIPLALLLEARQHNDELRRELVFVAGSAHLSRRLDDLARHVREQMVPTPQAVGTRIDEAVANRRSTLDFVMDMSPEGSRAVQALADLLDEADRYCDRRELLTLASSPSVRAFRRWCTDEVRAQGEGRAPTPWQE